MQGSQLRVSKKNGEAEENAAVTVKAMDPPNRELVCSLLGTVSRQVVDRRLRVSGDDTRHKPTQ